MQLSECEGAPNIYTCQLQLHLNGAIYNQGNTPVPKKKKKTGCSHLVFTKTWIKLEL